MLRRKPRLKLFSAEAGGRARRALWILLFAVVFLLSGLMTWLVLAGRNRGAEQTPAAAAPQPARKAAQPALTFQDFILPPASDAVSEIYPLRSPTPRWDDEQIDRYWIPLREITLDYLSAENDTRAEKFLEEVP